VIKEQLTQLRQITDAVFQAKNAELAREVAREEDLRKSLATLVTDQSNRATAVLDNTDTAMIAGADVRWRTWVEQRRRLINAELAQCRVAQAQCRRAAAKAFGRYQAVLSLEENRSLEAKRTAVQRSTYTS